MSSREEAGSPGDTRPVPPVPPGGNRGVDYTARGLRQGARVLTPGRLVEERARSLRSARCPIAARRVTLRDNGGMPRRSYGTGSLASRRDMRVRETWYARVRVGGRQLKKAIGPKREPGGRDGLTRRQAEARLRRLIEELERAPAVAERLTVEEIGTRYIQHLTALGRRRSTLQDYKSYLRVHLVPFFGEVPLEKIGRSDVEDFIAEKLGDRKAPKSVRNYLGLLHSLFAYAEKQEWTRGNPCKLVEQPGDDDRDLDIRFLDVEELEALLRSVPDGGLRPIDRALYLTAAMTGLRQGELLGLRWRDIDWAASRERIRLYRAESDPTCPPGSRLWSRRSRVRVPSLTLNRKLASKARFRLFGFDPPA
jgi:hypothetical protein